MLTFKDELESHRSLPVVPNLQSIAVMIFELSIRNNQQRSFQQPLQHSTTNTEYYLRYHLREHHICKPSTCRHFSCYTDPRSASNLKFPRRWRATESTIPKPGPKVLLTELKPVRPAAEAAS